MPTCPCPSKSAGGFTLVEMLVVLTVLGIAAVLLVGRIGGPTRFSRERAVEAIEARITDARHEARRSGEPVRLDPARTDAAATFADPTFGDSLIFYPDGSSSGGTILLGGEPALTVDWVTSESSHAR